MGALMADVTLGGNWKAGLSKIIKDLSKVADKSVHAQVSKAMATEMLSLIKRGFRTSTSPDGAPWKPVLRGGSPLRNTGLLANSLFSRSSAEDFAIFTTRIGASLMQSGGLVERRTAKWLTFRIGDRWSRKAVVYVPARPFLPEDDIPSAWQGALEKAGNQVLRNALGTLVVAAE